MVGKLLGFFVGNKLKLALGFALISGLLVLDAMRCERIRAAGRAEVQAQWDAANAKGEAKIESIDKAVKAETKKVIERVVYLDRAIEKEVSDGSVAILAAQDEAAADREWLLAVERVRNHSADSGQNGQADRSGYGADEPVRAA